MTIEDLLGDGPPVKPADLACALGVTPRYVRKLIAAGARQAVRLPSAGKAGAREVAHPQADGPRPGRAVALECWDHSGTEGRDERAPALPCSALHLGIGSE